MYKNEAFSGLEAAIVLIAFVVVAAVFSYVMLGAGFFATQKSQEVTYSGIKQSTSNLVVEGQLYGSAGGVASPILSRVEFSIAVPEGGQTQLLKGLQYVITSSVSATAKDPKTLPVVYLDKTGTPSTKTVLNAGEKLTARIEMPDNLKGGQSFTIEIKPKVGAATLVSKTLSTGYSGGLII